MYNLALQATGMGGRATMTLITVIWLSLTLALTGQRTSPEGVNMVFSIRISWVGISTKSIGILKINHLKSECSHFGRNDQIRR